MQLELKQAPSKGNCDANVISLNPVRAEVTYGSQAC